MKMKISKKNVKEMKYEEIEANESKKIINIANEIMA